MVNYRRILVAITTIVAFFSISIMSSGASGIPDRDEMVVVAAAFPLPPGWSPLLPTGAWGHTMMYPNLFAYTPYQEKWIPHLAESFRWVDEFTLEVTLRSEAKWWDDTPITAHDVEFTWALGRRHVIALFTSPWDFLVDVSAIDDRTVQFVTDETKVNYFELIGVLDAPILPRHRWEAIEEEYGVRLTMDFTDVDPAKIVGGGPFRLSWWADDVWVYERVDNWWGRDIFGLPYPRYIVHRRFTDNPAANLALERLELDVAGLFTPAVWGLWEDEDVPLRTYFPESPFYKSGGPTLLWMNFARSPLDNPTVRRAIAHAIPIDDLIEKAYFGYSPRAHPSMIIHTLPAAKWIDNEIIEKYGFHFDPEIANALLDEANIIDRDRDGIREMPDGTKLGPWTIEVPFGWTDWMMMSDMIAHNLRKIGVAITSAFPDFAVWTDRVNTGEFDIVIRWSAGPGLAHPWNMFRVTMDPRLTGPVGGTFPGGNFHRYINPEVIPLIDAIPMEIDPDRLREYYRKLQKIALRDVVTIPLFYGAVWYVFSEKYWTGWPKAEYPDRWMRGVFAPVESLFPTIFGLVPAGEDPELSAWATCIRALVFPTTEFWDELSRVIYQKQ